VGGRQNLNHQQQRCAEGASEVMALKQVFRAVVWAVLALTCMNISIKYA
jgi:hypothetical protein